MKSKDIAARYSIEQEAFDRWIVTTKYPHKVSFFGGVDIDDRQDAQNIVDAFTKHSAAEKTRLEDEKRKLDSEKADLELAAQGKRAALASMLITSGFSFEGYAIKKYSGYISGDDAVQIDRGTSGIFSRATDVGASLMSSLVDIRRKALAELKEAAYDLGCNAVIGVDFDYLTLDPQTATSSGGTMYLPYVFGVTANGNAVVIEKMQ